jgi:hypothetical protein
VTTAITSYLSGRRPILLLLLMAALIASPIPSAEVHRTGDAPETLAEASPGASDVSEAIPTTDGNHLHLDQCCQHAQVEAPIAPEVGTTSHVHPPERLRQELMPGTRRPPYRPPIA